MSEAGARTEINQLNQTQKNAEYIEKKINSLSFYSAYWCLFGLRSLHKFPDKQILRDDTHVKSKLIHILKKANYSPKTLDEILQKSADESVPLSYVRWFYEDDRAALWLNMVLKKYNAASDYIQTKSDIAIFSHNLIFNANIRILGKAIHIGPDSYNDALVLNKKQVLGFLERAYVRSKVGLGKTKWLDSRNDIQINHLYQYMQKPCDLNNLYANKINKKTDTLIKLDTVMPRPSQALIYADTIAIKESDRVSRLNHILASLDYWMFDTYWFDGEIVAVEGDKANNRITFIEMMKNVSNSKANRISNKNIKEKGLVLTSANKKILSVIAKRQGKTQAQMLNDIVASYDGTFFSQIPKSANSISAFTMGNYGETYISSFETEQSLKAKQTSPETISVDVDISNNKDISHQIKTLEPTPYIEESNDNRSEERVEDVKQNQSDEQSISLGDNHDDNKLIDEPVLPLHEDTIAPVNIFAMATDGSTTKLQAAENNLARSAIYEDININQIADHEKDPFKKNAEIMKKQLGGALKK